MSDRLLICLNGNDGQIPQVRIFLETLSAAHASTFPGDIALITTGLSASNRRWLSQKEVLVHMDTLDWLFSLPISKRIGLFEIVLQRCQSLLNTALDMKEAGFKRSRYFNMVASALFQSALRDGKHESCWASSGRTAFETYRNKHFSKLGLRSLLNSSSRRYDRILFCDADMIFQRPLTALIERMGDLLLVGDEVNSITPGTDIYRSNRLADRYPSLRQTLSSGEDAHEPNVGVLAGTAESMLRLLEDWIRIMFHSGFEDLFTAHPSDFWHEQDFLRLLRDRNPTAFGSLARGEVLHLSNHGHTLARERAGRFTLLDDGTEPMIVHFAGASWRRYRSIRQKYQKLTEKIM